MRILVTGGAGYIGSHTCVELLNAGYEVVIVDNLSNSKEEAVRRIEIISGRSVEFYKVDLLDEPALEAVFQRAAIDAVIHFAGLKAVGESVAQPLRYYHNNLTGTLVLWRVMDRMRVRDIVFSSSCTVYGEPQRVPVTEDFPRSFTNPYGHTKLIIEDMFFSLYKADSSWNAILLRYFNPVGAHSTGRIGEDPQGIPNNLLPYISQVAVGRLRELSVFGGNYPTRDGTGVRDYIHVVDLAKGHLKALEKLQQKPGVVAYNLGTGRGYSVLEVVQAFEKASGIKIPYRIVDRRPGDVAESYADPSLAERELGWKANLDIHAMCTDVWRWQSANPNGYE
jgi:UDP-glucose 4-epimerase